ncbi:hypothetical protein SBA6_210043 [Candidatus Sulfopaludibacter sp. SbA6]|nr:hypothetical protein SBA6_210043 [Candidatus Sulfopaludibacter sp. SbA6]
MSSALMRTIKPGLEPQTPVLQPLSQAVLAFYQATVELGIDSSVTTFTASGFGRTLTPSGNDGSDHAWRNHHFIIGTGVKGSKFYGNFPLLAPGDNNDANTRGVLIPTTAVDQYGSTLAQWFGVPQSSLSTGFPDIANFGTRPLGFLLIPAGGGRHARANRRRVSLSNRLCGARLSLPAKPQCH